MPSDSKSIKSHLTTDDPPPPYTSHQPPPASDSGTNRNDKGHITAAIKYRRPYRLTNGRSRSCIERDGKSPIAFPVKIPLSQTTTFSMLIQAIRAKALEGVPGCSERAVREGRLTYRPFSGEVVEVRAGDWCSLRESVGWEKGRLFFEVVDLPKGWVEDVTAPRRTEVRGGKGREGRRSDVPVRRGD